MPYVFINFNSLNNFKIHNMEITISILLTGIAFGLLLFALYESFGPNSLQLRDPFEEHED
jgi:hypothetical protein